jgi:hypothetical protein
MKGEIIAALGENRYQIKLIPDLRAVEVMREQLDRGIKEADKVIASAEEKKDAAIEEASNAQDDANSALEQYRQCIEDNRGEQLDTGEFTSPEKTEAACDSIKKNLKALSDKATTLAYAVDSWNIAIDGERAKKIAIEKQKAALDQIGQADDIRTLFSAHCFPDDEQWEVGQEVEVVEAYDGKFSRLVALDVGEAVKQCRTNSRAIDVPTLIVNSALELGVERWRPLYRGGQIKEIDESAGTCVVELLPATGVTSLGVWHLASIAREVSVNPKSAIPSEELTAYGVPFGHGEPECYEVGDEVLLFFPGREWQNIQVYGWLSDPRCCELLWYAEHGFMVKPKPRQVWLSAKLKEYYQSDGDPVCQGGKEHFYGQSQETACGDIVSFAFPEPLPDDGGRPVLEKAASSGEAKVSAWFDLPVDPADFSGLLRLTAQAMGPQTSIIRRLTTAIFGPLDPLYFGIVRDYVADTEEQTGRLAYWLVKVASTGVAMLKLGWPEEMSSLALAVAYGKIGEVTLTPEARTRYETLLLANLTPQRDESGSVLAPTLVVTQSRHETLIDGPGFAFLDGFPFFSPQPWTEAGQVDQVAPRCVLTDIRQRFDLGASSADPWERAITLEYSFSFDQNGEPSCSVQKLHDDKWWPRNNYFYRGGNGKICLHFAFSISNECPSHTDAVVAAWYNPQGQLCKLRQLKTLSESAPLSESDTEPSLPILGMPDGNCIQQAELGSACSDEAHRWINYSFSETTWELVCVGGGTGLYSSEYLSFSELTERSISLAGQRYTVTHQDLQSKNDIFNESTTWACSSRDPDDPCDSAIAGLCASYEYVIPDGPNAGETVYRFLGYRKQLIYHSLEGSSEDYKNLQNGWRRKSNYIARLGPSRDLFISATRETTYAASGVQEKYIPWSSDGGNKGWYGTQIKYGIFDQASNSWAPGLFEGPTVFRYVLPHSAACSVVSAQGTQVHEGSWPGSTYLFDGRNSMSELDSQTVFNRSSIVDNNATLEAPGYSVSSIALSTTEAEAILDSFELKNRDFPCFDATDHFGLVGSAVEAEVIATLFDGSVNSGGYAFQAKLPGRFVGSA